MPAGQMYLGFRGDGTVWARWPDGRWVEVVEKAQQVDQIERLRAALEFVADERSGETLAARMRRAREALKK
jgi:hypothetical protein